MFTRCTSSVARRALRRLSTAASVKGNVNPFPSMIITPEGIAAEGPFAKTQAEFMKPHRETVEELDSRLASSKMGVVAHFYMDAELQGTLSALKCKHVVIADSLAMGEAAVEMAKSGAESIACLGVDFMSESVRATLDASGFTDVPVYRLSEKEIGCSLAGAAEKREYEAWLRRAAKTPNSLHVVYINTSLVTKAMSESIIPTITCTSSNVVRTILQAFAQVPDLTVWYGPDTYMGANLETMLTNLSKMSEKEVKALHPAHTPATIAALLPRFHYYQQGNCIVHHMFGDSVVDRVRQGYQDAYHTAHLEVPGEMFRLAMEASHKGMGVVGSTSNILNFITQKAAEAKPQTAPLQFVLGTESGMITSIVRAVQKSLKSRPDGGKHTAIEIVFPVASEAVSATGESDMQMVPGVKGGEGCSTAGGCATCPYMKMNDLDALMDLVKEASSSSSISAKKGAVPKSLENFLPRKRAFMLEGRDLTNLGTRPILNMRHLMKTGTLSSEFAGAIQQARA